VSCPGMHEQLHPHVDGELDLVQTLEVEQHLRNCPACAPACGQIRELSAALRAGCRGGSEDLSPRISVFSNPLRSRE
jgi:anti-sigma factor RsiW